MEGLVKTNNNDKVQEYIKSHLRDGNTLLEFYNSIRLGWNLATSKFLLL